MGYEGKVFIPRYKEQKFAGWKSIEIITVNADSVQDAIKSIKHDAAYKFQSSSVHLDSVVEKGADGNEKRVYHAVWDEIMPLCAIADSAA